MQEIGRRLADGLTSRFVLQSLRTSEGRLAEAQSVIAGSPATVRDQILSFTKEFGIWNLLVMLQMGGMPHELTMKNINLFAEEVLPHLREQWADEGWENTWWPTGLAQTVGA